MIKMRNVTNPTTVTDIRSLQLQHGHTVSSANKKDSFAKVLEETANSASTFQGVKFSKHAQERMMQRGIDVSEEVMRNLNGAVQKAKEKGAKDTIVIGPQGAFLVNITNNVVITTLSQQEMRSNIFTNIDSAVLI